MAHRRTVGKSSSDSYYIPIYIDENVEKKETIGKIKGRALNIGRSARSKCKRLGIIGVNCCKSFLTCTVFKYRRKDLFPRKIESSLQCIYQMYRSTHRIQSRRQFMSSTIYTTRIWLLLLILYAAIFHIRDTDKNSSIIPVVIKYLEYKSYSDRDVGGFSHPTPRRFSNTLLHGPRIAQGNETSVDPSTLSVSIPDYGGLLIPWQINLTSLASEPNITSNQRNKADKGRRSSITVPHRRWADDDYELASRAGSTNTPRCRHPVWHKYNFQNCNAFHEMDPSRHRDSQVSFGRYHTDDDNIPLSHGYYRDTWIVGKAKFDQRVASSYKSAGDPDGAPFVLKTIRIANHNITHKTLATVRKDALIMERLTSSPRIIDIYGYCGTSMAVEYVENEMESNIVPGTGYMTEDLQKMHDWFDVHPRNSYSAEEKLKLALSMAESLADLHGFKDGVIVHDDVQLCQWLKKKKTGTLKLGDFNRAGLMLFDETANKYCKYSNGGCYGNYRAPEEFAAKPLDEAIDVYSFGNNIYALLTGLWVFYTNEDDSVVQTKVINGERAFIDLRYRNHSFIESKLVEVMEMCWIQEPEKRITIFDAIEFLRQVSIESGQGSRSVDLSV